MGRTQKLPLALHENTSSCTHNTAHMQWPIRTTTQQHNMIIACTSKNKNITSKKLIRALPYNAVCNVTLPFLGITLHTKS